MGGETVTKEAKNTLLTVVSGSIAASSSMFYILMRRSGISISRVAIFFLKEEVAEHNLDIVRRHMEIIASKYGLSSLEIETFGIDEDNAITRFPDTVRQVLNIEKQQGNNVYVDATCGRKYISNLLVKVCLGFGEPVVDILYCRLRNRRYKGIPCPRVPVTCCEAISILSERCI